MTPKSLSTVLILSLLFLCGVSPLPGSWKPIRNVKAPDVQEAAKFAVTEHNNVAKSQLVFESVQSGDQQVVSGMNYRLIIAATDGGINGKYEAVVWDQLSHNKKLTSFRKL